MVSIRGRILTGTVVSTKMHRTLIVRREYLHFIPKYARYEKRHANLAAHVSPAFRVEAGDTVTVGQCRPLSKTVSYNQTLPNAPTKPKLLRSYELSKRSTGSFQCIAGATENGTAVEAVQQVLSTSSATARFAAVHCAWQRTYRGTR